MLRKPREECELSDFLDLPFMYMSGHTTSTEERKYERTSEWRGKRMRRCGDEWEIEVILLPDALLQIEGFYLQKLPVINVNLINHRPSSDTYLKRGDIIGADVIENKEHLE